jgi:hypothetical protein
MLSVAHEVLWPLGLTCDFRLKLAVRRSGILDRNLPRPELIRGSLSGNSKQEPTNEIDKDKPLPAHFFVDSRTRHDHTRLFRIGLRIQPVIATHWLKRSAGVS